VGFQDLNQKKKSNSIELRDKLTTTRFLDNAEKKFNAQHE